jgi:hypothetical protein
LPATIAVLEGVIRIGLTDGELIALAGANGTQSKAVAGDRAERTQLGACLRFAVYALLANDQSVQVRAIWASCSFDPIPTA